MIMKKDLLSVEFKVFNDEVATLVVNLDEYIRTLDSKGHFVPDSLFNLLGVLHVVNSRLLSDECL